MIARTALRCLLPLALALALPAGPAHGFHLARVVLPLRQPGDLTARLDGPLMLRVQGDHTGFWIEVTSSQLVPGCPANLAHWAPHGPDPSEIMPWHLRRSWYPNQRSIRLCGYPLDVQVLIRAARVAGHGQEARFVAGTLFVAVVARRPGG